MTIRRASIVLPCDRLDDLPTHLTGREAADLLAAWTSLWHPSLIAATGALPGWHPVDNVPDPSAFSGELVLLPSASRRQLADDWCDRMRETSPTNPPPVEAVASRAQTLAAALRSAALESNPPAVDTVADFLALGFAHLQVELLTRAMHYSSVLDVEQFTQATVAAACAAVAHDQELAHSELARAFDLLATARNHVYSVDYYLVDVTLLAPSTLGESLRAKLACGSPTSLLFTGRLLEQIASEHPDTLVELRRALEAGTACIIGGADQGGVYAWASPESVLRDLERGRQRVNELIERDVEVFAQFDAAFSPLLPQALVGAGFRGALHTSFDGTRLPRADQCKTWWGPGEGASIETLALAPLDVARPETWLGLAERVGDTIAHDHVATVLLAGWPGDACEYFDDLRRAARYGPVLGKLVTLDEYFRVSRVPDEWTTFHPREYPLRFGANHRSGAVDAYRRALRGMAASVAAHFVAASGLHAAAPSSDDEASAERRVVINPWNLAFPHYVGVDPLEFAEPVAQQLAALIPVVPGCGYASVTAAVPPLAAPLADGRTLRNERLELTVSESTGGIQSLRAHRDRSTRLSQRLAFHRDQREVDKTKMVAERVEITRNDPVVAQITSTGRLLDQVGQPLARFTQTVRLARGLSAAIVDVQLEPDRLPEGDLWSNYFASRIAWAGDALALRRGMQWAAVETARERIESPEWIEVHDGVGTITCFSLGLPLHRQASPTFLDTILITPGESRRRFQFALAIDNDHPAQTALGLVTAGHPYTVTLPGRPKSPTGWFLHVGAKNVLLTHAEPLAPPRTGIQLRLLETEGRDTSTTLAAFRPIAAARITDFRGEPTEVLSVSEGRAPFDIGPHRWIQLEAEW